MDINKTEFPKRENLKNRNGNLTESIKNLDLESINFTDDYEVRSTIAKKQKTYFYIRVYLNEEVKSLKSNDIISLKYIESGEKLDCKFVSYGKKGLEKDLASEVLEYNKEDDVKVLCLMLDAESINENSEKIPFLRTLFRMGKHFQFQMMRLTDLSLTTQEGKLLDYYDIDFS